MARTFVFSEDMAVRAEVVCTDDTDYNQWTYVCEVHDLMRDPAQLDQFDSTEDAIAAAEVHVDGCQPVGSTVTGHE